MPTYNAYTKTNDFPIIHDFIINPQTGQYFNDYYEANNYIRQMRSGSFIQQRDLREIIRIANSKLTTAFYEWVKKHNIPQNVVDAWLEETRRQLATSTPPNPSWWERIANQVTNTVNTFINNAGNVLQGAGESVLWAKLLPFKVLMVNALRRKGEDVKLTDKMSFVTRLFKQRIIDKKTSTNYLYHNEADVTAPDSGAVEEMNAQEITSLIKTIIDFITLILQKKKDGTASEDERLIAKDGEDAGENVVNGGAPTTTGVNAPTGDNWFSKYKFVIIGAVAVVLFLAFRKKK